MNNDKTAIIRKLLPALITVTLLVTVFWVVDIKDVFGELRNFPVLGIVVVLALLGINLFIVSFRLTRVFRNFGLDLPMGVVTKANISGHLAGLFFISLFGQVAGRHLVLRRSGIPSVVIASLTAYERAVALLISGGLFFVGATILLENVLIEDFLERIPFAEIASVIAIGFTLSIWLWGTSFESRLVSRIFSWSQLRKVLEISLITIIARLFVLSAFVASVTLLRPDIDYLHLFAAAAITSFAANLPLTIHGWGLRELAAVSTLGLLGVPTSEALAMSILIGLCSTAVIVFASPIVIRKRDSRTAQPELNVRSLHKSVEIERVSVWMLSMATAALVFFQIHVEVYGGVINLNLADPFAVLSIAALAAHLATTRQLPKWRIDNFNSILIIISVLLFSAFLNGLREIGLTQWALANRVTGWFVILGYLSAGYLVVSYLGNHGLRRLSETLIVFAVVVVLMRAILRYLAINGWIELSYLPFRFEGYAGNRNAFAFQMLVCSVLLLAYSSVFIKADRKRVFVESVNGNRIFLPLRGLRIKDTSNLLLMSVFHGVILAGILFSGSRAGLVTGAVLLIAVTLLKLVDWRFIGLSIVFALFVWNLPTLVLSLSSDSNLTQLAAVRPDEVSNTERWQTFSRALALWLEYPIVGAGLGVFIEKSTNWSSYPINIHSTPLWILAEFGLVGVIVFTWILYVFARFLFTNGLNKPAYRMTAMLLLVFLLFGLVHEIFYQRIFWLILGAAMALPGYSGLNLKKTSNG